MKIIIDKDKCCGCHACYNSCPQNAIKMIEDERGFKYPQVDARKCINCGICKKVCPIYNSKEEKHEIDAYACYNKNNEERLNSSSGGIFVLLAREIIQKGGVVFGARFDNDFTVIHSVCENEDDIPAFMQSKYTQSTIGDTYKKAKIFLEKGKTVLFTGTPCQIEGLKSFLQKDYENLYTQDIICHGVPSPRLLRKCLEYKKNEKKEGIKEISFRNKNQGWSLFRTKIVFETKEYSKEHSKDLYMKAFLSNTCLRQSCYNCSFKKIYRISDITLADYWGINRCHPEMNDDKGVSLVIINSLKGRKLFDSIRKKIIYKKTNLDKALKYNGAMTKSAAHSSNEKLLFDNIDSLEMKELVRRYVPKPSILSRIKDRAKRIIKKIIKI